MSSDYDCYGCDDRVEDGWEAVSDEDDDADVLQEDDELLRKFDAFHVKVREMVRYNPAEMRPALTRYLQQGEQLTTMAGMSSALHCFGRYSGLATAGRTRTHIAGTKRIGVQPTAIARRRMCCGGKNSLQSGRPTKRALTHEHGYSRLKKSKSQASVQQLPSRRLPAPHNMSECVTRNVSLGKTHSTK